MARILVIDDDSDVRALICGDLRSAGHDVTAAADGAQGLALQRQSPAELVVTDIFMPEKEGIETIRSIRKLDPSVPILAISGGGRAANTDFLPLAEKFGANGTLAKPFSTNALLNAVRTALPTAASS